MPTPAPIAVDDGPSACLVRIKAVPGARRDEIVGRLGDRLKVRVAAPPEGGKANAAICELLANALGVRPRDVTIVAGLASAEKTARALAVQARTVNERWP